MLFREEKYSRVLLMTVVHVIVSLLFRASLIRGGEELATAPLDSQPIYTRYIVSTENVHVPRMMGRPKNLFRLRQ